MLDALADALQLDDAERAHLFALARAAGRAGVDSPQRRRRAGAQQVRPVVQRIVDSIGSPATVSNMRGDYLTANALGRALYAPLFDSREQPPNAARFTFLSRQRPAPGRLQRRAQPPFRPRRSTSSQAGSRRPRKFTPRARPEARSATPAATAACSENAVGD